MTVDDEQNSRYDIFLCHNHADKTWVRQLAERIESEEYYGRQLKVFFDEWDIKPGDNIVLRLDDAISKSRYVGVVLSREMLEAEWPNMEWTMAVYSDPSGRKGKVIPIWRGGCEIPAALKIRSVLYCRNDVEVEKSYRKLIALLKNQPLPRAETIQRPLQPMSENGMLSHLEFAEEVQEQLAANLFPVVNLPPIIWSGPTHVEDYKDVYVHLKRMVTGTLPTFLLRNKRLYCFWNLTHTDCPFRSLLSASSISRINTKDWLDDTEKCDWLIEMLNRALKNHCLYLDLYHDREHARFFFKPEFGGNKTITWNTGVRRATRTVVRKYRKGKEGESFWAHQSVRARFLILDKDIFLEINPGWTFTEDGRLPLSFEETTSLSSKWMHDEYNISVFYNIRFWSFILARGRGKISLSLGDQDLEVDVTPAVAEVSVGIGDDQFTLEKVFEVAEHDLPQPENMLQEEDDH